MLKNIGDSVPFLELNSRIINCVKCPRLVEYRQRVARVKRHMYQDFRYWGRPIPGFGDPLARVLIIGLAPAAHGGNRTGRMFTGDRSGDWLFDSLHQFGFANQGTSVDRDDGLTLEDLYITSVVRCAPPDNKPLPSETENCRPYVLEEVNLLQKMRVVLVLGKFAFDNYLLAYQESNGKLPSPLPKFSHGAAIDLPNGIQLFASYHPSRRNTQTGVLTKDMFHQVLKKLGDALNMIDEEL